MDKAWEIFCAELTHTKTEHGWIVHSFVLMSNHFHLIVSTPKANISICMQQFMYRTSKALTAEGNRINQTFAGRHYKCILEHYDYFLNAYKYNYRNPVNAGLCEKVEDYPYSSLYGLVRQQHTLPDWLEHDDLFYGDPTGILQWLNEAPSSEQLEAVRFGLKRQFFRSKKNDRNLSILKDGEHI